MHETIYGASDKSPRRTILDPQVESLRTQAARCRRLAGAVGDAQSINALTRMALDYDAKADQLGLGR